MEVKSGGGTIMSVPISKLLARKCEGVKVTTPCDLTRYGTLVTLLQNVMYRGRYERAWKTENPLPPMGFEPRIIQPIDSRYRVIKMFKFSLCIVTI